MMATLAEPARCALAVKPGSDAEFGSERAIEIRHVAEPAIEGGIENFCGLGL